MKKPQKFKGIITTSTNEENLERRGFMKYLFPLDSHQCYFLLVLQLKLRKQLEEKKLTINTLERTTKISGLEFTETELEMMLEGLNKNSKIISSEAYLWLTLQ